MSEANIVIGYFKSIVFFAGVSDVRRFGQAQDLPLQLLLNSISFLYNSSQPQKKNMFRSGQQVGIYTLIAKLGRGGFGEVWLAEKRSQFVTKKVAVKLPHEDQIDFDKIRQEATLWEQASGHPNVLPIIDADVYDDQVVIVSEYADGGSLADKIAREEKIPLKESVELAVGILSGLDFLHNRQIIHRDIKPQNILLQGNTPRLADFGISRAMQTTMISSTVVGTDAYMSPESFDGKRNAQTDIWSVGVVLYQLLKGSLPFPQEHPSERMFAVLTKSFEPLPDEIPSELKRITQKALAKQPEHRYRSAAEMREDLQKALVGIAHPTLAKTEVLIKPDLAAFETSAPKVETNEPQFIPPTIPNVPVSAPPNNEPANIPAPTLPSYGQESVVTEFRRPVPPPTEPAMAPIAVPDDVVLHGSIVPKPKLSPVQIIIIAVIGFFVTIVALSGWIWFTSPSNLDPHIQSQIDQAKKENPYFIYTDAYAFEENKKFGFKNAKDGVLIPAKYDGAWGFSEGLAMVKLNDKYGFIDENDKVVVPIKYENAMHFSWGLAYVKVGDKYGFIDKKDNMAIPAIYDTADSFTEDLAPVQLNGKCGFIDRKGSTVIPFNYGAARGFNQGFAVVCTTGFFSDNCGMIDKTGKEVTPFKYDYISMYINDMCEVTSNNKVGFLDKSGREVIPVKYDSSTYFDDKGHCEVKLNGRKLRIDKSGNETDIGPAETANTYPSNAATNVANTPSSSGLSVQPNGYLPNGYRPGNTK